MLLYRIVQNVQGPKPRISKCFWHLWMLFRCKRESFSMNTHMVTQPWNFWPLKLLYYDTQLEKSQDSATYSITLNSQTNSHMSTHTCRWHTHTLLWPNCLHTSLAWYTQRMLCLIGLIRVLLKYLYTSLILVNQTAHKVLDELVYWSINYYNNLLLNIKNMKQNRMP